MTEELKTLYTPNGEIPIEPVKEVEAAPFVPSERLKAAVEAATKRMRQRTFSERHTELGKMINCKVCGLRHRQFEHRCEQKHVVIGKETNPETGEEKPILAMPGTTKATASWKGIGAITAAQIYGRAMFKGRRKKPRNKPLKPKTHWFKILSAAAQAKLDKLKAEADEKARKEIDSVKTAQIQSS